MAEPAAEPVRQITGDMPPEVQAALRRANRVIANLTSEVADKIQECAVLRAALAEAEETADGLRQRLVEVTGGAPGSETEPSETAPSTGR